MLNNIEEINRNLETFEKEMKEIREEKSSTGKRRNWYLNSYLLNINRKDKLYEGQFQNFHQALG